MVSSFIDSLYLCRLPGRIWCSVVTCGYDREDGPPYEEALGDIRSAEDFLETLNSPPGRLDGLDDFETIVARAMKLAPRLARETAVLLAAQRSREAEERRLQEIERAKQEQVELAAAVQWAERQGLGRLSPEKARAACLAEMRRITPHIGGPYQGRADRAAYLRLLGLDDRG